MTFIDGRQDQEGYEDLKSIERNDIALVGVSNADICTQNELIIGQMRCKSEYTGDIATLMNRFFRRQGDTESTKYWISMDASSLSSQDFRSALKTDESGLSVEFIMKFYEEFIPKSVGMDLTEVNF